MIIFTTEAVVVGYLYHRTKQLTLSDAGFWVVVGIPMVLVFYGLTLNLPREAAMLIAAKQALNGVFNTIVAQVAVAVTCIFVWRKSPETRFQTHIQPLLFNLIVLIAIVSAAVPSIQGSDQYFEEL